MPYRVRRGEKRSEIGRGCPALSSAYGRRDPKPFVGLLRRTYERGVRKKTTVAAVMIALALAAGPLAGCSMDRWAEVEPGEYTVVHDGAAATMAVAREIQRLDVDRDGSLMVLTLVDGSEIVASFVPRERRKWPAGCPTNIHSTRMEVLDIVQDPLIIGATRLRRPILVRDCPPDPVRIVLREDGAIGGGGTGCPYPEPCLYFAPRPATASPFSTPLPHGP